MQNQLDDKVYAGFFVRFVAFAIDSLIAALVVVTIKSPFSLAASSGLDFLNANFLFHYSFLDVLDYIGVAAYFVLLTYFTHTTPGKAAMRLEVVTADKEWTLINVIYRETIGRFFSSLLCAGYFAVLISQKKQGFHDMLCDTYVVYKGMVPQSKNEPVTERVVEDTAMNRNPLMDDENSVLNEDVPQTDVEENAMADDFVMDAPSVKEESVTSDVSIEEEISTPASPVEPQKITAPTYYTKPEE